MLLTLTIKNFVLIESLSLDFSSGFCSISGETGAGKSILLDSICFALGHKSDSSIVRHGEDYASVIVEFSIDNEIKELANQSGIILSDILIIKRQQFANGKKKFFINDEPVTGKIVKDFSDCLIEIHGQKIGASKLLNPANHLRILDQFGALEGLRDGIEGKFIQYQKIKSDIADIEKNTNMILREIDYLEHVCKELNNKCPQIGEEEELSDKRLILKNADKRADSLKTMQNIFHESNFYQKISSMQKIATDQGKSFLELEENLNQAQIYLQECEESLNSLITTRQEGNLEEIEVRLFEIRELSRKYKKSADQLPEFLKNCEKELLELKGKMDNADNLKDNLANIEAEYTQLAKILSERRKEVGIALEKKIRKELPSLQMENCEFRIDISHKGQISSSGMDEVRFLAATNPGMDESPIDKIASGGEMSRLMLAIKLSIFDKDSAPTIIFDEIDTGIGGRAADSVGDRIKSLSLVAQTIIITHQPQIASKADYNILVSKDTKNNNTVSHAEILDVKGKNEEIARMISGAEITQNAIKAAKEMIS